MVWALLLGLNRQRLKIGVLTMYIIIFRPTGQQIGKPYSCLSRARRRADKLDNAYGAYVHTVRKVEGI